MPSRAVRLLQWLPCALSCLLSLTALALGHLAYRGQNVALGRGLTLLWGPLVSGAVTAVFALAPPARRRLLPVALALVFLDVCLYYLPTVTRVPRCGFAEIAAAQTRLTGDPHPYRWIADSNQPLWQGAWLATGYTAMVPAPGLDYRQLAHLRLAAVERGWAGADRQVAVPDPLPRVRLVPNLRHRDRPLAGLDREPLETTAHCRADVHPELSGPPLAATERVTVRHDGFDRLELEVHATCLRLLVVSDRWTRDWQATVAGLPTPILPLYDGTIRGLLVPPGRSPVVMSYAAPAAIRRGAVAAAAGLVGIAGLLCWPWWQRRWHGRRPAVGG